MPTPAPRPPPRVITRNACRVDYMQRVLLICLSRFDTTFKEAKHQGVGGTRARWGVETAGIFSITFMTRKFLIINQLRGIIKPQLNRISSHVR